MTTSTATFTKLRNGTWGVKGKGLKAGQTCTVTKRDGSISTVAIDRILWSDNEVQIASVVADRPATTNSRLPGTRRRECDECGEWATPGTVCWETGFEH